MTTEEYPGNIDIKFTEPAIKVTFADHVRDVVLRFSVAEVKEHTLYFHLTDAAYPLQVTLVYRPLVEFDLIERYAILHNDGQDSIALERVFSAQWHLPYGDKYRFSHLAGRWLDEFHLIREPLTKGVKVIESRRIHTSHHHNPYFAVDKGNADEDQGEVWFGALAWSGNWKIAAEVTDFASTRINIGLNDWDFGWELKAGTEFTTPSAYAGYTSSGFGSSYLRHLYQAGEMTASIMLSHHNLAYFLELMSQIRSAIRDGNFSAFRRSFLDDLRNTEALDV